MGAFGKSEKDRKDKTLAEMLKEPKYICLCIASFIVIGVGQTYNFQLGDIATAIKKKGAQENMLDFYWLAEMIGRFGGGLLAYVLFEKVNTYKFACIAAICSAVGFGLTLLCDSLTNNLIWPANTLIGIGTGLFWVIPPMTVMDDAGPKEFGLNWGLIIFCNFLGIFIFGKFFDAILDVFATGGKCEGGKCILIQHILFGILCLVAAGLCYYALKVDDPVGPSPKDREPKNRKSQAGKDRSRKSEKDKKKKEDKKSKSKDKKSKDKKKSKSKSKDKKKN